ncbi:MAG: 16S rRNA (guanine(527)-N(7))-methyltransferase RsmG [SAR202 cluster bacterium]|nr:16S rRNA (guanine(527)-N(7))-methyltransferase RsmG [SAR202 cluster bacterium]
MKVLDEGAARLGVPLDGDKIAAFERYAAELLDWNSRFNLTAVTDPLQIQSRHFLDSLTTVLALPQGYLARPGSMIDIGSGAGFPGIPLKIAFPQARLTLLEATAKKTAFLSHVAGALGLVDTTVVTGRAEDLGHSPEHRARYDLVVCRAVARLNTLAEITLPFAKRGGLVVAHKGPGAAEEIEQARKAIRVLGGSISEVKKARIEGSDWGGVLVVIEKVAETPSAYPRRAGVPGKSPL